MREIDDLLREISLDVHRHAQWIARTMGIPATDVHAMGVLKSSKGGVTANRLGGALGLTPSATSSLIDRLEAAQYAVRSVSPIDARRADIVPTAHAIAESRERFAQLNATIDAVLDSYTDAQVRQFATILGDLRNAISSLAPAPTRRPTGDR